MKRTFVNLQNKYFFGSCITKLFFSEVKVHFRNDDKNFKPKTLKTKKTGILSQNPIFL